MNRERELLKKARQAKDHDLRRYGITLQEYRRMYREQNGRCLLCKTPSRQDDGRRLAVDHDHKTGRVRGLLCARCNQGLGNFCDSPDLLERAARYLRNNLRPTEPCLARHTVPQPWHPE